MYVSDHGGVKVIKNQYEWLKVQQLWVYCQ